MLLKKIKLKIINRLLFVCHFYCNEFTTLSDVENKTDPILNRVPGKRIIQPDNGVLILNKNRLKNYIKSYSRLYFIKSRVRFKIVKLRRKINWIVQRLILIFRRERNRFVLLLPIIVGNGKVSLGTPLPQTNLYAGNVTKEKIIYSMDYDTLEILRNKGLMIVKPYCKEDEDIRLLKRILYRRIPLVRINWIEEIESNSNYLPKRPTVKLGKVQSEPGYKYKTDHPILLFSPKQSLFRRIINLSKKQAYLNYYHKNPIVEDIYTIPKGSKKIYTSDGKEITIGRIMRLYYRYIKYGMKNDPLSSMLQNELYKRLSTHTISLEQAFECLDYLNNKSEPSNQKSFKIRDFLNMKEQEKTRSIVYFDIKFK